MKGRSRSESNPRRLGVRRRAFGGGVARGIPERKRAEQLLALEYLVTRHFAETADVSEALQRAIRAICESEDWGCGRYLWVDDKAGVLRFGAAWSVANPALERYLEESRDTVCPPGWGLVGKVWQSQQPLWVADIASDPRVARPELARTIGMRAALVVPVAAEGRIIGVLIFHSQRVREPDEQLLQTIGVVGALIAQFMQRARAEVVAQGQDEVMRMAQLMARFIVLEWDVVNDRLAWSTSPDWLLGPPPPSGRYPLFKDMVHPDDRQAFLASRAAALDGTREHLTDYRFVRTDGKVLWLAARGKRFVGPRGRAERMLVVIQDISERKQADQLIAENELRYRLLFESSPVPLYVFQRETLKILAANERMAQQYGWSREELAGMSMLDLRPPAERAEAGAAARNPVKLYEGRSWRHWRRTGEIFEIEPTAYDLDYQGQPARLVAPIDVSGRERTERALREAAEDLRSLSRRLVSVQEDYRRALARELHDRAGQNLTALAINLEMLRGGASRMAPHELERRARESVALIESTARIIDDITAELHPPMLDEYGLAAALRWYGEQQAARTGLRVDVRAQGDGPAPRPARDLALFRIVQEAMNNVLKHARASRVEITLTEDAIGLELCVRDDGRGLDAPSEAHSLTRHGVRGMRERVLAIGGQLEIALAPGGGTIVRVRAPL